TRGYPVPISPHCNNNISRFLIPHPDIGMVDAMRVENGIQYLHGRDIVHGDLKPRNILMRGGHPLLCDFCRSMVLTMRGFTTKPAVTARYQAPELLYGMIVSPDKPADVYAFGVT
ncbi:kinase-like protein, partial [Macrolepiota fuliginosa MF-IS2]